MPGATETDFFERADMMDTKVGQDEKDDPADVARVGFDSMMRGGGDVVSGWKNKLQTTIASITRQESSRNNIARWPNPVRPERHGLGTAPARSEPFVPYTTDNAVTFS
jgi:short-subunit dehydrogenase